MVQSLLTGHVSVVSLQGVSCEDFYVTRNGRLTDPEDALQHGAVYRLEPRLCGGKGGETRETRTEVCEELSRTLSQHVFFCGVSGFGSMLRALGAQIEKTTNREACRDLSGRRLRDVNHEKE